MQCMKTRVMWAIVDRKTGELGVSDNPYHQFPLLYEREEWARGFAGRGGRVVKVEIREVPDTTTKRKAR